MLPKSIAEDFKRTLKKLKLDVEPNLIHTALVKAIRKQLPDAVSHELTELISQAARERRYLG